MATRKRTAPPTGAYRLAYMTDVARGASHIASALSPGSRDAAIEDVVADFRAHHPQGNMSAFLTLLAQNLEQRGSETVAQMIRDTVEGKD